MEFFTYKQTRGKNSINGEDGTAVVKELQRSPAESGNKKKQACVQVSLSNFRNNKTVISCINLLELQRRHFCSFQPPILEYFVTASLKQTNISRAQLHHRNSPFHEEGRKHRYKHFGCRKFYHKTVNLRNNCQSLLRNNCWNNSWKKHRLGDVLVGHHKDEHEIWCV